MMCYTMESMVVTTTGALIAQDERSLCIFSVVQFHINGTGGRGWANRMGVVDLNDFCVEILDTFPGVLGGSNQAIMSAALL